MKIYIHANKKSLTSGLDKKNYFVKKVKVKIWRLSLILIQPGDHLALDKEGDLTLYLTGQGDQLPDGRPPSTPLYSRGRQEDFRDPLKYNKVNFIDLVKYYTFNDEQVLLNQCVHNNHIYAVFGSYAKYNNRKKHFWCSATFEEFMKEMKSQKKSGNKFVYSVAADQSTGKIYAYAIEGYGNFQVIMPSESPKDLASQDLSITGCFALNSKYYFLLTAGVEEFKGKKQKVATAKTRTELEIEIQTYKSKCMIITSVCFSVENENYLVVMTESDLPQQHKWFTDDGTLFVNWDRELYNNNNNYKIQFFHPIDGHQLCVRVKDSSLQEGPSIAALLYSWNHFLIIAYELFLVINFN